MSQPETPSCQSCKAEFTIEPDEQAFIADLAPQVGEERLALPLPTLCPRCRQQRRLVWRNERKLYRRKCSKTGEEIVSMYAPDKAFPVYSNSVWWGDSWDPLSYGRNVDLTRSIIDQLADVFAAVPRPAISQHKNVENSQYTNNVWHLKDCYLSFNISHSERVHYSDESYFNTDLVDCLLTQHSERSYEQIDCNKSYGSGYLESCSRCSNAYLSYECRGCSDIILCTNLSNQRYCIRNVQYSKEEYERWKDELNLSSRSSVAKLKEEFTEHRRNAIHAPDHNHHTENSTGDYLTYCKDCTDCFFCHKGEHLRYVSKLDNDGKDCVDIDYAAEIERCYDTTVLNGYEVYFSAYIITSRSIFYSSNCHNSRNLFGCAGLRNAEYCILNRQYSKEMYEALVPKIVSAMQQQGEWGEFFPMRISPFGYNESAAQLRYPLEKAAALDLGASWQDNDFAPRYDGPAYEPRDDIAAYRDDEAKRQALLSGVLRDESTGQPFKIIAPELAFYLDQGIPVPTKHPDSRYKERARFINPPELFKRTCRCAGECGTHQGNCDQTFRTTYAPDRPERVFCRQCYDEVITHQDRILKAAS